ncbi:MAG: 16S rRNA (guanine(966)-N(2))-methyltransferase RsmD, partial [Mycoplasma sp.]|nr:16S rRNA (guanine(966)-N(2))-methyltransferase RsmD [Mycoplasma sp.]
MKIRIIAGKLRNLQIKLLNNFIFRPSREKLREAFFSSLHFEIENKSFLDAFGGSGIFGFEAFSRGANVVNIVEKKYTLYKQIESNAKKLRIDTQIDINNYDFIDYLKNLDELKYDYIFLDPPYD